MSGHSKWSKVKHQKEATDAAKGKIFTKLSNAIIIAVRQGGGNGDPSSNFKLRLVIDKARSLNMPKEKIEKAIERGRGMGEGVELHEVVYEAFGPEGIGIIIVAATDNKQRTVAQIKNILERNGGRLATAGAVSHLFKYVGKIELAKNSQTYDQVFEAALNAGAEDLEDNGETFDIYTDSSNVHKIKDNLLAKGYRIISSELEYKPQLTVPINDKKKAEKVLNLLSLIEESDDIHKVFANFDIPEEYIN